MATVSNASRERGAPSVAAFAAALSLGVGATLVGHFMMSRWGNQPVALLYILPVLAAAVIGGLWPSLVTAAAATLAFNYWFTEPFHTLAINSPADVVTVAVLFLVALVTSRLAGGLRENARLAAAHAARNATIAGFARNLLSSTDELAIAQATVAELANLLHCQVVFVSDDDAPSVRASVPAVSALAPGDLAAAAVTLASGKPTGRGVTKARLADWQFRPIASAEATLAAVGLAREDGELPVAEHQELLVRNLLDQVALALGRARLEHNARELAAVRERDSLRTTLLDSIGEDVKPRLNAIAAAVRELKRAGAADKSVLANIADATTKLDRFVSNLVDLGAGEDREPIQIGSIGIDLYRRVVRREGEEVHLTPKEHALLAELTKHAGRVLTHGHLLRTVWGPAQEGQIDYLRVAIRALRQKLEADPARPQLIVNEPAIGYRLVGRAGASA